MWGALQDAARTVTLLLDKSGEGHRKCPRCRGSGLLENAFTKLEKGAHPNQPCWFCEGIGALPIAGLNGFVLARTTPFLKVLDNHNQICADIVQHNNGRHCKEKCKFTNAKLDVKLADLLFDSNKSPWVNCTSLGCQQENMLEEASDRIIEPSVSEPRLEQPLPRFLQEDPCLRNAFFQRILNAPLVRSIVDKSRTNAILFPAPLVCRLQPNVALVPGNQKTANIRPALKLKGAFATQYAYYMQKTSCSNVITTEDLHLEPEFSEHFITKLQVQTAANMISTEGRRLQQKARSCDRHEAKKDAQEVLLSTLKQKGEPDLADFHLQPKRLEAMTESVQGLAAHVERFFPSDMPSRVVWLTTVSIVSRQLLLNRLIADAFKVLMPTTAKLTR